ncbi:MAG: hypothetical protein EBS05_13990 [Proteobacteria bacterium]|nr:hypothetical protein [Pseudomonadota bacterium]
MSENSVPGGNQGGQPEGEGKSQQGMLIYLPSRWLFGLCLLQFALLISLALMHWLPERPVPVFPAEHPPVLKPVVGESELFFKGKPGPWGELSYVRINIEPPDEFVPVDDRQFEPTRWHFLNYSRAQLTAFFNACDLTLPQRAVLTDTSKWQGTTNGIFVTPPNDLILELNTRARTQIYTVLAESEENPFHVWPGTFRNGGLDEWFRESGLAPATLALVKNLAYPRGPSLCFSDMPQAFSRIPSIPERRRLVKTVSRQSTLLMKLHVAPTDNIGALASYWARGGRAKDIAPLLESLSKVPGGANIDVAHLLPPFARKRLNSYPYPLTQTNLPPPDCFWTAMNFFNEPPDERYNDYDVWRKELQSDFTAVPEATFGDLVFFLRADGTPLHAAVYIADDVVFTKNGGSLTQPWILMKLEDVLSKYPTIVPMRAVTFRSNKHRT